MHEKPKFEENYRNLRTIRPAGSNEFKTFIILLPLRLKPTVCCLGTVNSRRVLSYIAVLLISNILLNVTLSEDLIISIKMY